ncbi:TlpA family protein disulfide reductase [Microbacterium gorillae]|uniref:TlpA family protein disulfide reductase n=1 Tax=Microbacterium gorillae TaxID=1231063 RepID=UPI00058CF638|nr:thioredoxin family protein [Microbacterium gorillae]
MSPITAVLVLIGVLTLASAIGFWQRHRARTARTVPLAAALDPHVLGAPGWGSAATLVQFSTRTCATCPGVRRVLGRVADERAGVAVVDVDLTDRLDLADRFHVLQTPTVLLLDAAGVVRARLSGAIPRATVEASITRHLENAHA